MIEQQKDNHIEECNIRIADVHLDFEREPLVSPFGFKGAYIHELWQSACMLVSDSGIRRTGVGTQSILWSDKSVFSSHSESVGNALMLAITERALSILKDRYFRSPIGLMDSIIDEVYEYGKWITDNPKLRKTFVLNAMVGLDNALWSLYAAENKITSFDDMMPASYKNALSSRHKQVASIPVISYNVSCEEIKNIIAQGYFFLKIKIGQSGTQEEMLMKDCNRLAEIHKAIGQAFTPHTKNGRILYYLDANGRYEKKESLKRLIDYAQKIGIYEQIAVIEEPFPEEYDINLDDIDIRLAADESAHTDVDALTRIQMGYKAITLKSVAKTLSMTFKIADVAHKNNIPCICADLTASPLLIEWNKNVSARLCPFPGLKVGLLEVNGNQNYKNWDLMQTYSPSYNKEWTIQKNGIFHLDDDYYTQSGGVLGASLHYDELLSTKKYH